MSGSQNRNICRKCGIHVAKGESMLTCSSCGSVYHAKKCLQYSDRLVSLARTYNWLCGTCKRCEVCLRTRNARDLILCDDCDRGYHCFCLVPQLWKPPEESWRCPNCAGAAKENSVDSNRSTRNIIRRSRHASEIDSPASSSTEVPDADEVPSKRSRRETKPRKTDSYAVSSPRLVRSLTASPIPPKKKRRNLSSNSSHTRCPVPGCNGEGHLSGRFSRHWHRDFCPVYHRLTIEQTKDLTSKRIELINKTPKKLNATQQQHTIRAVDEERQRIESQLRKRAHTLVETYPDFNDRQPPLEAYVSKFDLDLFRMAQGELAEQMESDPDLRNVSSNRIKWIRFGRYEISTWYPSQFPGEFSRLEKLYICEYCLKFMRCRYQLRRHTLPGHCSLTHPPGEKIYEKGHLSVWEIDGKNQKVYCQNLCLLAMLFLDHKTLFKDVEAFYFYVLTLADEKVENNYHLVAYFSKEKTSRANCNLSCLLTLPPFLRRGYGQFLIDLSYALSKIEGKIGSPEHPLSDMGLKTYRNYWKTKIFDWMLRSGDEDTISIKDISQQTAIHPNDLVSTLQYFGMVKYWRGEYWILKDQLLVYKKSILKKKSTLPPLQAPKEIDTCCLTWRKT